MKIVLATETFYPAVDSTTTTLKATVDRLVDLGHSVRIVAPGPGLASYRGCDVVRVRPLEPTGAQVREAIESFGAEVVQVHSPRNVGRKALKHAGRLGVPTVVVEQSPVLDLAADYWRAKIADRADTVLVTSPWMVARAAELGVTATLWEPGVDSRAFNPTLRDPWLHASWSKARSRDGEQVVVGYVGGLHKAAGVRRLADVAAVPGTRLVVIGHGPDREWLARRVPGARFTGPLSIGDLTVAMPTLDVLVHPGEHETDCHALREAAASGVPVVAPRSGGARDVVAHLETGVLYDAGDTRDLVRAVAAVAGDPHRRLMGAAARERAVRRTWADAVDELVAQHLPERTPASV
ncbi:MULTISPECIES: glycosyltransferase [unclassified Nocardioides]|uniref:glycosyltransferase n=1 Tax=unclassified Nocardioides TaxID=2615069 RepID=UPI000703002A|nr:MULTISPECIES: glycosyltransferase [unclassified Nocardioides]KRC46521.1 glycosyl transferase family 1 [Nocardioides sp. Root79]KRC69864.1 glycosyl transferase family 1 [Nocardioides sp. Root240]